ncbi:MAG: cysteine desulfurase [Methanomassiliicoccaceae archaeon]|nr:cysteine desulfurase [Methanomassiliicoccaceae archaeon]
MDISAARGDFPTIRSRNGVYLDSACQSLRPDQVIRAVLEYYEEFPACGGRSAHGMSARVSLATDGARERAARFFGTDDPGCYVFTKNCTEGINTVARGIGLKRGDAVVTTDSEHNSNHVPWALLSEEAGVRRRLSPTGEDGGFDVEGLKGVMGRDVRLVSVCHVSNVTGCAAPIREVAEIAHDNGAELLVDGAQAAPHMRVDLKKADVDYYSISVHKMLGPSGMGILYGKRERLERLRPLTSGGGAVGAVTRGRVAPAPVPDRFEAGLQDYAGIAGTAAALDYLSALGMDNVRGHDRRMMRALFEMTEGVEGLSVVGPGDPDRRCGVFSFNIEGLSPHDVAVILDRTDNIMIRSGMHCAQPFFERRGIEGCARASPYLYNNEEDIGRFAAALSKAAGAFGGR